MVFSYYVFVFYRAVLSNVNRCCTVSLRAERPGLRVWGVRFFMGDIGSDTLRSKAYWADESECQCSRDNM